MPTLTVDQLTALADQLSKASTELFGLRGRLDLSKEDQVRIRDEERRLDGMVAVLTATSIQLIAEGASVRLKDLKDAMAHANETLEKIATVKKAISIATAFVNLAGALIAGSAPGVLKALEGLKKAADSRERTASKDLLPKAKARSGAAARSRLVGKAASAKAAARGRRA